MWSRLHLFESHYENAKKERQHVATVQDDFLRRSFGGLLADAEGAIMSAEDEIDRRVPGAEGRLRKAELAKEQIEQKRLRRLAETERGRAVARGGRRDCGQHPSAAGGTGRCDRQAVNSGSR